MITALQFLMIVGGIALCIVGFYTLYRGLTDSKERLSGFLDFVLRLWP